MSELKEKQKPQSINRCMAIIFQPATFSLHWPWQEKTMTSCFGCHDNSDVKTISRVECGGQTGREGRRLIQARRLTTKPKAKPMPFRRKNLDTISLNSRAHTTLTAVQLDSKWAQFSPQVRLYGVTMWPSPLTSDKWTRSLRLSTKKIEENKKIRLNNETSIHVHQDNLIL